MCTHCQENYVNDREAETDNTAPMFAMGYS